MLLQLALVACFVPASEPGINDTPLDRDGDGYTDSVGTGGDPVDCDDTKAFVNPSAPEYCNGEDDDCDGEIDEVEDLTGAVPTWYRDKDHDGFGHRKDSIEACAPPPDYVDNAWDCSDFDPDVNPEADERCNGQDDDCDGAVDEGDAIDRTYWYADEDEDGFGGPGGSILACDAPDGRVANSDDCDDAQPEVHPGAEEKCNGLDDDCNALVDEGYVGDGEVWHRDLDGDGFGDPDEITLSCDEPFAFVRDGTDCDDDVDTVHPGADERCNAVDDDCDGTVDEIGAVDGTLWSPDLDGDGYGAVNPTVLACAAPLDHVQDSTDCDDTDDAIHPTAAEICNGRDDDCSGDVDEGLPVGSWHPDTDGDGHGDPLVMVQDCLAPPDHVADATDCDDQDGAISPSHPELCNDVDDDCSGTADDGLIFTDWYTDLDLDGFGDPATAVTACAQPTGAVDQGTDCDDFEPAIHPAALELCDGLDNDCDGDTDESGAIGEQLFYTDFDQDGFGTGQGPTLWACSAPAGYADNTDDCDDTLATTSPASLERCDGLDNDCDFAIDDDPIDAPIWYPDNDGDGNGNSLFADIACEDPGGHVLVGGDCNDVDPTVFPGASELCNEQDDDCDGVADEDPVDGLQWYDDVDGDGFGSAVSVVKACIEPPGLTGVAGDCDDDDATIHPEGPEYGDVPFDGIDSDCNAFDECLDLNCDDEPDLVVLFNGATNLRVYYGQRLGARFTESAMTEWTVGGGLGAATGDFDGDGRVDIVTSWTGGDRAVQRGLDAHPGMEDPTPGSGLSANIGRPLVGDLDRDGIDDVVLPGNPTEILYGPWDGTNWDAAATLSTGPVYNASLHDVDGDELLDLVTNKGTGVSVYYGSFGGFSGADAAFLPASSHWNTQTWRHAVGDFDDDGYTDVLAGCYSPGGWCTQRIYWGSATGLSTVDRTELPGVPAVLVNAGDFDGDGIMDLTTSARIHQGQPNAVYTWWGPLDAANPDVFNAGISGNSMAYGDFDRDGYSDFILGNTANSGLSEYWRGSAGGWVKDPAFAGLAQAWFLRVLDLNADGYPDLVFRGTELYFGGPGGLSSAEPLAVGSVVDVAVTR